jgi:hypothetical protein
MMQLRGRTRLKIDDPVLLIMRDQQNRIEKLEKDNNTNMLKKLTASASASALFLGLVLTLASLYDVFVAKPQAERVARISQFNQTVNAAVKLGQDLAEIKIKTQDPRIHLELSTLATPQILNNISTAKAILRNLDDEDVGVPQLIVLISGSFQGGDNQSAKEFVERAVKIRANPYLRSEAKRYEGKYFFAVGEPNQGRESYLEALALFGNNQDTAAARAFVLTDLAMMELAYGTCTNVVQDLGQLASLVTTVIHDVRLQLLAMIRAQVTQTQHRPCPIPKTLAELFQL